MPTRRPAATPSPAPNRAGRGAAGRAAGKRQGATRDADPRERATRERTAREANGRGDEPELRVAVDRLSRLLASRRAYSRLVEAAGGDLSQQGATLLTALHLRGGRSTLTEIAKGSRIDLSAASRQLRELERRDLVVRVPDTADRRVTHLQLTPEGNRLAKRIVTVRRSYLERTVAHWPPEKRRLFADLINEFVDALMRTEVDPEGTRRARG